MYIMDSVIQRSIISTYVYFGFNNTEIRYFSILHASSWFSHIFWMIWDFPYICLSSVMRRSSYSVFWGLLRWFLALCSPSMSIWILAQWLKIDLTNYWKKNTRRLNYWNTKLLKCWKIQMIEEAQLT